MSSNDGSNTKIVSRIQNRQGRQYNIPPALRVGEFGWSIDTSRLFIGGDCDYLPVGIEVTTGFYTQVQNVIDNQIIKVTLNDTYDDTDISNFQAALNAEGVSNKFIRYVEDGGPFIFVGMTSAQAGNASKVSDIEAAINTQDHVTGVNVGPFYTVNTSDGLVETPESHDVAQALILLINELSGITSTSVVNNRTNVEVLTEFSSTQGDVITINLSPQASFTTISALDLSDGNYFDISYGLYLENGGSIFLAKGVIEIAFNIDNTNTSIIDYTMNTSNDFANSIEFDRNINGSQIELQYKHDFPIDVTAKFSVSKF